MTPPNPLIAAVSGSDTDAAVALAAGGRLVAACSQERATRLRRAGLNASGLPDQALDLLLQRANGDRRAIGRIVRVATGGASTGAETGDVLDHHFAHACTAYLTSPFAAATILVCDHEPPWFSVWTAEGGTIRAHAEVPGANFANAYSSCAALFGFPRGDADQALEALARLQPDARDGAVDACLSRTGDSLVVQPALASCLERALAGHEDPGSPERARMAAAVQARLAELFLEWLGGLGVPSTAPNLCLGGSFFYHSSINTAVKQSRLFENVFVPVDPGNTGLAVGAACHAARQAPTFASPFLGPSYSPDEIKATLDNCKLQYAWYSDERLIHEAVVALRQGQLVGWFDDRLEWGPRALGARCIVADPTAPYVLENLNRFLKHRAPWRGYALSGPRKMVPQLFAGPASAPFMECDYRPYDPSRFSAVLPAPGAALRIQTIDDGLPRFSRLLEAFGHATGLPFLVNSSFNGFHEPVVCSPRDAVRVFYGTGLDLLVIGPFVLRK